MAIGRLEFTSDAVTQAMLDGLVVRVREALLERITERIKPDIDAAVEAGLESLKMAIHAYQDPLALGAVVKILVEDRRT